MAIPWRLGFLILLLAAWDVASPAANWPQFRGPGGLGIAAPDARPPRQINPITNVAWKLATPSGNASPVIWGDRLILTGSGEGQLVTLALDRESGKELWRRATRPERWEEVHPSRGNPASATPVTEGERVYVFFGSLGLLAFDFEGNELWRHPLDLPQTEYGASSSPVLAGGRLVQLLDQDGGSHLLALDPRTGQVAWRVERPEMRRGFGTPLVWEHDGVSDLVVPGTVWLAGYDPRSGIERWRVGGLARITCTSPVAGDGLLLTASWTTGGDRGADRITLPAFSEFAALHDRNQDERFTLDELPDGPARQRFKHLDGNRDGTVSREEWESMAAIFARVENQAFAVKPGADGKLSEAGVLWRFKRGLPYVASPLLYRGRLYLVKNGGLLTCLEARTGRAFYQEERLGALGDYYASPVAADGRVYLASQRGVVTIVTAGDTLNILGQSDFGEVIQATPAIVGDVLYLRTAGHLYAFREGTPR